MSFMKTAAATLLLLVVSASVLFAQTATGEVRGTVNDPNGAALAGALVKLTNKATKIDFDAKTNEDGFFLFVNVRPGSYSLIVDAQGFKGAQTQFDVSVSDTVTQNITLTLGQVTEAVE